MFRILRTVTKVGDRSFKNFGHKRQPVPGVTTIWHGFLTFTFIGLGLEWKSIVTKVMPTRMVLMFLEMYNILSLLKRGLIEFLPGSFQWNQWLKQFLFGDDTAIEEIDFEEQIGSS